jgi:hypothetical protein
MSAQTLVVPVLREGKTTELRAMRFHIVNEVAVPVSIHRGAADSFILIEELFVGCYINVRILATLDRYMRTLRLAGQAAECFRRRHPISSSAVVMESAKLCLESVGS